MNGHEESPFSKRRRTNNRQRVASRRESSRISLTIPHCRFPQVLRVVDKCQELPTRFFAAKALSGANCDRTDLPEFTRPAVRRLTGSIGRHLAALHDLDAVHGSGTVTVDRRERLHGDRPAAPPEIPTVQNSIAAWANFRRWAVDRMLSKLDGTLFSDLSTGIRASLSEKLGDLTDSN
ncbi:MAG: hypothetical protein ACI9PP_000993 [Halobacteriales archaeon]|jgi:hypothetical protein